MSFFGRGKIKMGLLDGRLGQVRYFFGITHYERGYYSALLANIWGCPKRIRPKGVKNVNVLALKRFETIWTTVLLILEESIAAILKKSCSILSLYIYYIYTNI